MGLKSDATSIYDYFDANFSGTTLVQHGPNEPFNNPSNANYVRITCLPVSSTIDSFGTTARYKNVGVLSCDIYTQTNSGPLEHEDIRDEIDALFRRKKISTITFDNASRSDIGVEGQFYHANISFDYHRYELVSIPS